MVLMLTWNAEAYPQCINLEVTGNGTNAYDGLGTLGVQLYKEKDPGIVYNIYQKPHVTYINPGPPLVPGLPISISQGTAVITATSKATTFTRAQPTWLCAMVLSAMSRSRPPKAW